MGRMRSEGLKKALGMWSRSRSRIREGGCASELVLPALMLPPSMPLPLHEVPMEMGLGLAVPEVAKAEKSPSEDLFSSDEDDLVCESRGCSWAR